jgi:hypothetical protein
MTIQRADDRPRGLPPRWERSEQREPAVEPVPRERRKHPRFAMCISLRIRGAKSDGTAFHETTSTEVVSAGGFSCRCVADLGNKTLVDVFLLTRGNEERLIGRAQVVRVETSSSPWHSCSLAFLDAHDDWFLVPDESTAPGDDGR